MSNNVIAGPFTDDSLPRFKRQFAQEVKRNLFQAYLRPQHTIINFISTTTSSSSAFPGGEAFDFHFSPNGHWVLALCSSRIYVIDTGSPHVSVKRELKVLRRPVSATILDDGSILAVLSSDHRVNIYDLSSTKLERLRFVSLNNRPNTLALSPKGEVLAAAYDGGIEVHSLAMNGPSTERRAVKCDSVDAIAFSTDGMMLVGTTQNSKSPNTVILSAPYFTEGNQDLPASDLISHFWTSQILFPNSSRDCSHATLLPHHSEGDASWTFTFDRVFESFRAVRTDDLRNGTTYFTGPKPNNRAGSGRLKNKLIPCTLPAASDRGELVAAGFLGKDVWLYGVPESLDTSTVSHSDEAKVQGIVMAGSTPSPTSSSAKSPPISLTRGENAELARLPQWQVLIDKYRNVFAKGHRVAEIPGLAGVRWVNRRNESQGLRSISERLIIAAPGGVSKYSNIDEDDFAPVDGGRLVILDFDRTHSDGKLGELTFEVGDGSPELLQEEDMDMDTEVALVRQRTVRQRKDGSRRASVADVLASSSDIPAVPRIDSSSPPASGPKSAIEDVSPSDEAMRDDFSPTDDLTLEEASMAFDGPYSHTQPRSRTSLYRSATAVAANRQRNPPRCILESGHVEFRRADGRGELPHESDADNWVPPPPVYTKEPDRPLPEHILSTLLPRPSEPIRRLNHDGERPRRASTVYESMRNTGSRRISSLPNRTRSPSQTSPSTNYPSRDSPLDSPSGTVSSLSSVGFSYGIRTGTGLSGPSESSPLSQPASPSRRPVSAFVGRTMGSMRRPQNARLTSPISPIPEPRHIPGRSPGHSISLPASPVSGQFPVSNLTLSGANLQHRLDYPLPPAPERRSHESSPASRVEDLSTTETYDHQPPPNNIPNIPNMPSAQQLANLRNRYNQTPPQARRLPSGISTAVFHTPPPPRGALGAAGSPISPQRRLSIAQQSSISQRNSFAASTPALPRPSPRRLETIQSVSSFISNARARSVDTAERVVKARSRSAGPAVRVEKPARKGWFGRGRGRKTDGDGEFDEDEREVRGARCLIM